MPSNTESKRPEKASQVVEERFRAASEQAAVGMPLVGLDGRFLRTYHNTHGADAT